MSFTSTTLCCIALLVSTVGLPSTEAVPSRHDRDRAILAYTEATDRCRNLQPTFHKEAVEAADWACRKAFEALDDIDGNSCKGWRQARCRPLSSLLECSCTISTCTDNAIKGDVTKSFRDCAENLLSDSFFVEGLVLSDRFQRATRKVESDLEALRTSRLTGNAGGAYGVDNSRVGTSYASTSAVGAPYGVLTRSSSQLEPGASSSGSTLKRKAVELSDTIVCEVCQKQYRTRDSYVQHIKSHSSSQTTCKFCHKTLSTKSNLTQHINSKHLKKKRPPPVITSPPLGATMSKRGAVGKVFGCEVCGREYKTTRLLREHRKCHTNVLICKICVKSYVSKPSFDRHIKRNHPNYEADTIHISDGDVWNWYVTANPFACQYCGMRYSLEKTCKQHVKSHTSTSTTCTFCNRVFSTVSSLNKHIKTTHKEELASTSGPGE